MTFTAALLAALSMSGIPPFFGFIGKETIYETALGIYQELPSVLITTVSFMSKTFMMVAAGMVAVKPFFGQPVSTPKKAHEAPVSMWLGPVLMAGLGLFFGLLPTTIETLLNQATGNILGEETHIHLHLIPDHFSMVVFLSLVTIFAGAATYYTTYFYAPGIIRRSIKPIRGIVEHGPDRVYLWLLEGMQTVARLQTRLIQSGYLRRYLITILFTTVALASYALISRVDFGIIQFASLLDVFFYEWVVAIITLFAALYMVLTTSRLQAVVALGVVGFGMAVIFTLNSAPDLAMTQFAIETLSVILIVLVVYRLPEFANVSGIAERVRDGIIALAAGGLMTTLVLMTSAYPVEKDLTRYFAEYSYKAANGRNVVNVILVDFRALDTMGEITVLAIGAIGIVTLLTMSSGLRRNRQSDEEK
jgi:multicomponent Na+:H+ antiporter subunit A